MKDIKTVENPDSVGLVFEYDAPDDLVKTRLLPDTEEEVEISPLSAEEKQLRDECEKDIEEGLLAVNNVGYRLYIIKTQKLFRSTHRSFEKYVEDVFRISRVHANRKIEAYHTDVVLKSEPKGSVSVPVKETHGRVMAGLPPTTKVKIGQRVKAKVGDRTPTGKDWKDAADDEVPAKVKKSAPAKTKAASEPATVTPLRASQPANGMVWIQLPCDYHKDVKGLPSLMQLSKKARELENSRSNLQKKDEMEKLIRELNKWLPLYGEWEQKCLIPAANQEEEAA